jgi:hypothetical protein
MPAELVGTEVEIRPVGSGAGHHPHVAVVLRPTDGGDVASLVYPELVHGNYELYEKGTEAVELTVAVTGGEVTEAAWPRHRLVMPAGAAGAPSGGRAAAG